MPSTAYGVFNRNLKQVDKLLQAYNDLRSPTRGRKHLDHLTRASIIFLCSSWEVYLEQIASECCRIISNRIATPKELPEKVRRTLASSIRSSKHDLEPIEFAMDWKAYYCKAIQKYVNKLNTPKNGQVLEILEKYIGADIIQVKAQIPTLTRINDIVKVRGEIAHNIYSDEYVREETVFAHKDIIVQLVKEIELFLWGYIPLITNGMRPWQNTYR